VLCVQVIHYLRESNRWLLQQVQQQGAFDRQVITSVFKDEKRLRLELNRKLLHQAIDSTFDKYCVRTHELLCPIHTPNLSVGGVDWALYTTQVDFFAAGAVEKNLIHRY